MSHTAVVGNAQMSWGCSYTQRWHWWSHRPGVVCAPTAKLMKGGGKDVTIRNSAPQNIKKKFFLVEQHSVLSHVYTLTGLLIQKMSALSVRVSSGPKSVMGWASTRELCFLFSMLGLAVLYREWIWQRHSPHSDWRQMRRIGEHTGCFQVWAVAVKENSRDVPLKVQL